MESEENLESVVKKIKEKRNSSDWVAGAPSVDIEKLKRMVNGKESGCMTFREWLSAEINLNERLKKANQLTDYGIQKLDILKNLIKIELLEDIEALIRTNIKKNINRNIYQYFYMHFLICEEYLSSDYFID